ncbi:hypothetical protein ACOSQ4_012739 [Xanthoceras sorbifolium]
MENWPFSRVGSLTGGLWRFYSSNGFRGDSWFLKFHHWCAGYFLCLFEMFLRFPGINCYASYVSLYIYHAPLSLQTLHFLLFSSKSRTKGESGTVIDRVVEFRGSYLQASLVRPLFVPSLFFFMDSWMRIRRMLEEIDRDGFRLYAARRHPILLSVDCLNVQVPPIFVVSPVSLSSSSSDSSFENLADIPLAKTSSFEEAMAKGTSLYGVQRPDSSDNSYQKGSQLLFSSSSPSFLDTEPNVVTECHLRRYREYYEIPREVKFVLIEGRTAWNPPKGYVAIYGFMLNCGVTLPLQPFVARFLSDVNLASAQLVPNGYRTLMALCTLWRQSGFSDPTPREIRHCYQL